MFVRKSKKAGVKNGFGQQGGTGAGVSQANVFREMPTDQSLMDSLVKRRTTGSKRIRPTADNNNNINESIGSSNPEFVALTPSKIDYYITLTKNIPRPSPSNKKGSINVEPITLYGLDFNLDSEGNIWKKISSKDEGPIARLDTDGIRVFYEYRNTKLGKIIEMHDRQAAAAAATAEAAAATAAAEATEAAAATATAEAAAATAAAESAAAAEEEEEDEDEDEDELSSNNNTIRPNPLILSNLPKSLKRAWRNTAPLRDITGKTLKYIGSTAMDAYRTSRKVKRRAKEEFNATVIGAKHKLDEIDAAMAKAADNARKGAIEIGNQCYLGGKYCVELFNDWWVSFSPEEYSKRERRLQSGKIITVYHKCPPDVAAAILSTQSFIRGGGGMMGGGIYFADNARSTHTKALWVGGQGVILVCNIILGNCKIEHRQAYNYTYGSLINSGFDSVLYKRNEGVPGRPGWRMGQPGSNDEYVIYTNDQIEDGSIKVHSNYNMNKSFTNNLGKTHYWKHSKNNWHNLNNQNKFQQKYDLVEPNMHEANAKGTLLGQPNAKYIRNKSGKRKIKR